MHATSLLESQHREVEALFKKLESGADRAGVLEKLANSLAAHMAIEQDIFYPAIKQVDDDLVNEAFEEHSIAEVALKRLLATGPDDEVFSARVTALKEVIEHHVSEEEDELFPEVDKALSDETNEKLGRVMEARFDAVLAAGFEAAVPSGLAKTSADLAIQKNAKARSAA